MAGKAFAQVRVGRVAEQFHEQADGCTLIGPTPCVFSQRRSQGGIVGVGHVASREPAEGVIIAAG